MTDFAKLFLHNDQQILVVNDLDDDDNPIVTFTVKPENFGLCSASIKFKGKEGRSAESIADSFFKAVDQDAAIKVYESQLAPLFNILEVVPKE
jgi:hypothetical protein